MEDRETPRMRQYGESKTTRIMMATVPHVTSGLGLRKFQADGFLLDRVYYPSYHVKEVKDTWEYFSQDNGFPHKDMNTLPCDHLCNLACSTFPLLPRITPFLPVLRRLHTHFHQTVQILHLLLHLVLRDHL